MATIDDFGGTTDPLNQPALGGPTGWAAAVRDYCKGILSGQNPFWGEISVPSIKLASDVVLTSSDHYGLTVYNEQVTALAPVTIADPTDPAHGATKLYVDGERTKLYAANQSGDVVAAQGEWAGLLVEINVPPQPTSFIALITGIITFDCLALTWGAIKVDNVQFGNQYNSPGKEPAGGGRGQVMVQVWYSYPANQAMNVKLDGGYATASCTLKAGNPLSVVVIPT